MVFSSVLGFLLIVASVGANIPDECVQNPSLPRCHPQGTVMEDVPGEYVRMCIEGLLQNMTCQYCNLNNADVRCKRTFDIGFSTFECFIHNVTDSCDYCNLVESQNLCLGFPRKNVSGELLKACINGLKSSESCDFCRSNRYDSKCLRPSDIGEYTVECILNDNSFACDLCYHKMNQARCIGFPEYYKKEITGKTLHECIEGPKGNKACELCRVYRSNIKCEKTDSYGDQTVSCVLDKNSEACDTCNARINLSECLGFPSSHVENVTGKTMTACFNGTKDNEACDFCRKDPLNKRCKNTSNYGVYTLYCVLLRDSEACDTCNENTNREGCFGFPEYYKKDITGKTLHECIEGPKNNTACEFCRKDPFNKRCKNTSNYGVYTLYCVLVRDSEACDTCIENTNREGCFGFPEYYKKDITGKTLHECIEGPKDNKACEFCRDYRSNIKCEKTESYGHRTVSCVLDKNSEACDTCNEGTNSSECLGFPASHFEFVNGKTLYACINGPKDNTACDFCKKNRSHIRCERQSPDLGEATVKCVLDEDSEACDECNESEDRQECNGFPDYLKEDITGKTLTECINGPKDNGACDFCRSNRSRVRCQRPSDIGELTVECVLNETSDACDTCNDRTNRSECVGFPVSHIADVTGKTLTECINGPKDNGACDFCRSNRSRVRCQRPSDIGELTVECVLNETSDACDTCNDRTNRSECVGFPVSHIADVTGKTLTECINGPKYNGACDFCRFNRSNVRCEKPASIGVETVRCVLDKNEESCDMCNDQTNREECSGFPASHSEDVTGKALKACIDGRKNNYVCYFCRRYRFNIRCQRPSSIGDRTVECVLDEKSEACDTCNDGTNRPECLGFPVSHIEDVTGKTLKACVNGPKDNEACDFCRSNQFNTRCQRDSVIGEVTVECVLNKKSEACDICNDGTYRPECVGFPVTHVEDVIGKSLRACINGRKNNEFCTYCEQHPFNIRCKRPSDIGEVTVDCVMNGNQNGCEVCKRRFMQPECAGFPAPSTENYGAIMKKCYDDRDLDACRYCFTRLNEPECRRSFVGLAKSELLVDNAETGLAVIASEDMQSVIAEKPFTINGRVGTNNNWTFVGSDSLQSRID